MKSLFEQIDSLEPLIPQEEMNALHAQTHWLWVKHNPERHKAIYDRNNAKRKAEDKAKEGEQ